MRFSQRFARWGLALLLVLEAAVPSAFAGPLWIKRADNTSWSGKTNVTCVATSNSIEVCLDRGTSSATNAISMWTSAGALVRANGPTFSGNNSGQRYADLSVIGAVIYVGETCTTCGSGSGNTISYATVSVSGGTPSLGSWTSVNSYTSNAGAAGFGEVGNWGGSNVTTVWSGATGSSHAINIAPNQNLTGNLFGGGCQGHLTTSVKLNSTYAALFCEHNDAGYSAGTITNLATTPSIVASRQSSNFGWTVDLVNGIVRPIVTADGGTNFVGVIYDTSNTRAVTVKSSDVSEVARVTLSGDYRAGPIVTSVLTGSTAVVLMKSDGTCTVGNSTAPTSYSTNSACNLTLDASDNARTLSLCPDWDGDTKADPCVVTGAGGDFWVFTSPPPVVTISANPSSQAVGENTTITWSVTDATSCTASGAWSGSKNATSGSEAVAVASAGTNTYTLSCTGPGGSGDNSTAVTGVALAGGPRPPPYGNSLTPGPYR